jgi:murein DD-endopeptidase MepM/ murein hydrolase activator NlpD
MHGLPPAILEDSQVRCLIDGRARFGPQPRSPGGVSTGGPVPVAWQISRDQSQNMFTATAHAVLAVIVSALSAVWPLDPRPPVVHDFEPPAAEWGAGHRGVDLLGNPGQMVRAAADGTVTFAGMLAGRGVVVVDHGQRRTTYEPVSTSVAVGKHVEAGQRIGVLQSFGGHCWPRTCLHWGLLEGGTYLDPLTLVGGGPVRLLPMFAGAQPAALAGLPPAAWSPSVAGARTTPSARFVRPWGALAGRPDAAGRW